MTAMQGGRVWPCTAHASPDPEITAVFEALWRVLATAVLPATAQHIVAVAI
jgi:hypothetical protein